MERNARVEAKRFVMKRTNLPARPPATYRFELVRINPLGCKEHLEDRNVSELDGPVQRRLIVLTNMGDDGAHHTWPSA